MSAAVGCFPLDGNEEEAGDFPLLVAAAVGCFPLDGNEEEAGVVLPVGGLPFFHT